MSRAEDAGERGVSGSERGQSGTRRRLWIFVAILALTFLIVLAVAFL